MRKLPAIVTAICFVSSSASAELEYHVVKSVDPFTDQETCKTILGSDFSRSLAEGVLGWYGISYFFVERKGKEIAAGITNDHNLPVPGDIQIRVDSNPVITITPADTPEDMLPPSTVSIPNTGYPEMNAQIAESMRVARAQLTPFRVVTGEKAKNLITEILNGQHAIWRSVTLIARADQGPAEIRIDGLKEAVAECGIDLSPSEVDPAQNQPSDLKPYSKP